MSERSQLIFGQSVYAHTPVGREDPILMSEL
jgi:hypothetical protein